MPVLQTDIQLAGAPISWGVCEVPGWGVQLPPDRVLAEMSSLGLTATELGPVGYLPDGREPLRALLAAHALGLVGGFVPLVLHEPSAAGALRRADAVAQSMAAAGAEVFVAAAVMDEAWAAPRALDAVALGRLMARLQEAAVIAESHGLRFALHPHAGTLVESAADVGRVVEATGVGWCLDTGHLLIGGTDPVTFARVHGDRIEHVHLKDVDAVLAARHRAGDLTLQQATRAGMFRPLGDGDARVAEVLEALDAHAYDGWLVLEQDVMLDAVPAAGEGPRADVARSLEFLAATRGSRV